MSKSDMEMTDFFKTLNNKINNYNKLTEELANLTNPFTSPKRLTIIWVDKSSSDDKSQENDDF